MALRKKEDDDEQKNVFYVRTFSMKPMFFDKIKKVLLIILL